MPAPPTIDPAGNLALIFQEVFTAITRLRANQQKVSDAESFRANALAALGTAQQQSQLAGYSGDAFQTALLAIVGFLDESILNSRNPAFADWPRRPLSDELFHHHRAGEFFFENVDRLVAQPDSPKVADVLEVYHLCLLLGYGGRYSGNRGELRSIREKVAEKVRRFRADEPTLTPGSVPPRQVQVQFKKDPWSRRLAYVVMVCLVATLALFIGFKASLSSGASRLSSIAGGITEKP